jgi:hypothetical protein
VYIKIIERQLPDVLSAEWGVAGIGAGKLPAVHSTVQIGIWLLSP